MKQAYLAGPMRGYAFFNFPAFDAYQKYLEKKGYRVVSPAQLDREAGFDPNKDEVSPALIRQMIIRDVEAICESEILFLMPGWKDSSGVRVEKSLAEFLNIPIKELPFI